MRDGSDAVAGPLEDAVVGAAEDHERVAFANLLCELRHLDGRSDLGRSSFVEHVGPILARLPLPWQAQLLENKTDLLLNWTSVDEAADALRHAAGRRALLGGSSRDYRLIVAGVEAARAEQAFDALPAHWSELRQAYAGLSWRRRTAAHATIVQTCLVAGEAVDAVVHAIRSGDEKVVSRLTAQLGERPDVAAALVPRIFPQSALILHARHAATAVGAAANYLPDDDVPAVAAWLRRLLEPRLLDYPHRNRAEAAWDAVAELAPRLDAATAAGLVTLALDHEDYAVDELLAKHVLRAVCDLVARLTPGAAGDIALRLAARLPETTRRGYADTLHALCQAVERSQNPAVKQRVRVVLYPPGRPVADALRDQIAPLFDVGWADEAALAARVAEVASLVRRQVERLAPGEQQSQLGGLGTVGGGTDSDGNRIVAHIFGAQCWIDGLVAHATQLGEAAADELAEAIVTAAADPDNLPKNRAALLRSLHGLAERVSDSAVTRLLPPLTRLAAGEAGESSVGQPHAVATHPMNPIRIGSGDPSDAQGQALIALAGLASRFPTVWEALRPTDQADEVAGGGLLLAGLTDANARCRSMACVAARELDRLADEEVAAVLLLTRDADPETAAVALSVFRRTGRLNLDGAQLGLLLSALGFAARRSEAVVRSVAAGVLREVRPLMSAGSSRRRADAMLRDLSSDPAASVREATTASQT